MTATDTLPFEMIFPEDGLPYCVTTTWDGHRIAWSSCATCHQHLVNCVHDVPVESAWLQRQRSEETARLFTREQPGDGAGGGGYSQGARDDRYETTRVAVRKSLNVMDLVDQDLVDQIKTAKESHADN